MSKISIKLQNGFSVEYEGSDEFINDRLVDLISNISGLVNSNSDSADNAAASSNVAPPSPTSPLNYSVKTIIAKIGNSKGSDLAKAAAIFLVRVQNRETFTQAELLAAMKTASGIYKQSTHGKNMGSIMSTLIESGFLLETAAGTFTVAEESREQYKALLS